MGEPLDAEFSSLPTQVRLVIYHSNNSIFPVGPNEISVLMGTPEDSIVSYSISLSPMTSVLVDVLHRKVRSGRTENDKRSPASQSINKAIRSGNERHRTLETASTVCQFDASVCTLRKTEMSMERPSLVLIRRREILADPRRSELSEVCVINTESSVNVDAKDGPRNLSGCTEITCRSRRV